MRSCLLLLLVAAPLAAQTADLSVTLSAMPTSQIADPVAYPFQETNITMTVTNNGPQAASNVVLTETLTRSDLSGSFQVHISGPCSPSNPTGTCAVGTLASGQSVTLTSFSITDWVTQDPTLLNITATVSSSTSDPNTANNTATALVTLHQPTYYDVGFQYPNDVLRLTPTAAAPGDLVTIGWDFCGPNPPFTVTVPLPLGMTLDSVPSGVCHGTTTVTCEVPGQMFTYCENVIFKMRVGTNAPTGAQTITATISTPYAVDSNPADNTVSGTLQILAPVPALSPLALLLLAFALSAISLTVLARR